LTGRENIYLNGAILGMRKNEIDKKFDEIVKFSGVEEFIDTPVKRYSSGMHVRLAFSVAAHLEPEILLVDEVLAVGDASFQKKCLGKMKNVANEGRTVLFVSHNMAAIRQLCPTCLWIDHGMVKKYGESCEVISSYLAATNALPKTGESVFAEDTKKNFQLCRVKLRSEQGVVTQDFDCDRPVYIELECQVRQRVPGLYGYLSILRKDGTVVMVSDSFDTVPNPLDNLPEGRHLICITIPARSLGHGEYDVYLNFTSRFGIKNFHIDSPGTICTFRLSDFTSLRGNSREGYFSTQLSWVAKEMPVPVSIAAK
jgi:lipopolysaccharide transport system ATP-binding protein